jgi:hypothetical protein
MAILDAPPAAQSPGAMSGGASYPSMMRGAQPSAPQGQGQPPGMQPPTAGGNQLGGAAARLGMEIDQSLKLLSQALPALLPWVERITAELRTNIGMAIAQGANPNPAPAADNAAFPTGAGRL